MKQKIINKINVHDKPRVFFVASQNDFGQYFEVLSDEILSLRDCAIYYYENEANIKEQDWQSDLSEMNLIVVPITEGFLNNQDSVMDMYLFSQEKNIPALPIMVEKGLDKKFNYICGQKQYLDRTDSDPTSIPYLKKLGDYLSAVLIGSDLAQKVRSAFDAYIFLSYRKKDRKYAQELMRSIHNHEFAKSVAIWYDEFLQPDENFNDAIKKAIQKCNLFALAVTPNLVNENNYVISQEYPAAKNAEKQILPIELIETDIKILHECFPDLPTCISIQNPDTLTEALLESLSHIAKSSHPEDPRHDYYIGLAYLHGIDVEIDRDKGLALLSSAAERGVVDAAKDLVSAYYNGIYGGRNFSKSIYWQQKITELLQKEYEGNPSAVNSLNYADALRHLVEIERQSTVGSRDIHEMISICVKAKEICENVDLEDFSNDVINGRFVECKLNTLRTLAILYEMLEDFEHAEETYRESIAMRSEIMEADKCLHDELVDLINERALAQVYADIGIMYRKSGNYSSAVSEMQKSIEVYRRISTRTQDYLPDEAHVHEALSGVGTIVDISLAEEHSVAAIEICRELAKKDCVKFELHYASAMLNRAFVLTELGSTDFDEIEGLCLNAEEIYKFRLSDGAYEISCNYTRTLYALAGVYRKKSIFDKAKQYYEKAYNVAIGLLSLSNSEVESNLTFAHLFFDYGTFIASTAYLGVEPEKSNLKLARELLCKALSLFEKSGNNGKKYIVETKKAIETIDNECKDENANEAKIQPSVSDPEAFSSLMIFQSLLQKGDDAENSGNYEKAYQLYKSALEQLSVLQQIKGTPLIFLRVELLDRLAVSCEMNKDVRSAQMYYMNAADLSFDEAMETHADEAVNHCIFILKKVISFFEDNGFEVGAHIYRHKLNELMEITRDISNNEDEDQIIRIPNEDGEICEFRLLDIIDNNGYKYAVIKPLSVTEISLDSIIVLQLQINSAGELEHIEETDPVTKRLIYEIFKENNINRYRYLDDDSPLIDSMNDDETDGLITLKDENGLDISYEFLTVIEYADEEYVALLPADAPDDEPGEVVILKVEGSEDGEETYVGIEDQDVLDTVFEIFKEKFKDEFAFEDSEDD